MSLAIITGGSKGFGRAVAVEIAKYEFSKTDRINHYMCLVLTGRDPSGLAETAELLKSCVEIFDSNSEIAMSNDRQGRIMANLSNTKGDILEIVLVVGDLCSIVQDSKLLPKLLFVPCFPVKKMYLFHNAGSLGDLKYIHNSSNDPNVLSTFTTLNLSSVMQITSLFLRFAAQFPAQVRIINISSLAAIQPFAAWSWYCSIKAARDMFFRVLAVEQEHIHSTKAKVKTLNYAPGMLDTNMQKTLRSPGSTDHEPHIEFFSTVHSKQQLLSPSDSAKRLIAILALDTFKSGVHIDYWDLDDSGNQISKVQEKIDSSTLPDEEESIETFSTTVSESTNRPLEES